MASTTWATCAEPAIVSCEFDDSFHPHLLAMQLDWRDQPVSQEMRLWTLPGGLQLCGPAPQRFGIEVLRRAADCYTVRLLWDQNRLGWSGLRRQELCACSFPELLAALGTDLHYLLEQPIVPSHEIQPRLPVG